MSQDPGPSPPRHSPPPAAPAPPADAPPGAELPAADPAPPADAVGQRDPAELERAAHAAAREIRPRPRPAPKAAPPARYEDIDLNQYASKKDVFLPLDDIKFDRDVDMGQLRALDEKEVASIPLLRLYPTPILSGR